MLATGCLKAAGATFCFMKKMHTYACTLTWTGNTGTGTSAYRGYERNHTISINNKPNLFASSDPSFLGDPTRYNPEELLLASLSGCHMLWFLHLCTTHGIVVVAYTDQPTATMIENEDGSGQFTEVMLRPEVTIAKAKQLSLLNELHHQANKLCFIARSVNFAVLHSATGKIE